MTTFEELGITPQNVRALKELGFEYPMPVQEKVIPLLLAKNTDIVALAQTGTGKTAAYGLPLIQLVDPSLKKPQALVLCPTRELCVQITGDLNDFAKYSDDLKILPVYGGASMEVQINALKRGVHIVVATPGRLVDLINRKAIKLGQVSKIVLDEADEMLNMGFLDSINEILAELPEERNTMLFSATMPREVAVIARNYMHNPQEVTIGTKNTGADNIKHVYYTVHAKDKYLALKRIVDFYPSVYGIVFCRTRKETQEVADKLIQDGYNAESLHGDLSQAQRDFVMQKFRIRHIQLLVATDVAARGLDVDDLTHVINYNLPDELDVYTHRSGRTGRAGKAGISIAIINLKEKHLIKRIEQKINKAFISAKVPGGREICEKQLFNLIDKMEKVELEGTEIDTYLPAIYRKLEWLDKEDIIKRFVALEFNRFLDYYKNAKDINVSEDKYTSFKDSRDNRDSRDSRGSRDSRDSHDSRDSRSSRTRGSRNERDFKGDNRETDEQKLSRKAEAGFTRLFINLGKSDGMFPANLIELINTNTKGKMIPIGKIDLLRTSTYFEVDSQYAKPLIQALKDTDYKGFTFTVGYAKETNTEPERAERPHFSKRRSGRRERS